MKRLVVLISFLFCYALLISCKESSILDETTSFGEKGWDFNHKVSMPFEVQNNSTDYQLYVGIRQSNDYTFHNFYFSAKILDAKGKIIKRGLTQVNFYNPQTGKSNGSGSGFIYSHKHLIFDHLKFPTSGKYIVQLEQFMRMDTIAGIVSIGATISPVSKKNGKN